MAQSRYIITGRITRTDTHAGIHGLHVEAWDDEVSSDKPLGRALTNQDGTFSIRLCLPDDACDKCPRVYLKLRDRDCRLIHDGCSERRCCEPGAHEILIDVALAPETLYWHVSRALSWQPDKQPLIGPHVFDEIQQAIELLSASGASPAVDLRLAVCATPAIGVFDRLLEDAWAALHGDLAAAGRYRDVLKALCAAQSGCCDDPLPYQARVEEMFRQAAEAECPRDKCADPKACEQPPPCEPECDVCACDPPFISEDKAIVLLMAALHVACNEADAAKRFVLALLDQLCRFEMLGALHRASVKAVLGDQASHAHVRDLLEFLCTTCAPCASPGAHSLPGPHASHGQHGERDNTCPVHRPLPCCQICLDEHLARCLREAIAAWRCIECYCIAEVRPPRACPGDEIVIVGRGFGERAGTVVFRQHGGFGAGPHGQIRSWCDDRITVIVPQGAGCGLWLLLPPETIEVCDRFLQYRRTGCIDRGFEGTSAEILQFGVKGHHQGECLEPGEPLHIRWKTCAADHVTIELRDLGSGAVIARLDPADPSGHWEFTAMNFTSTVRLRVQIAATGRCEPRTVSRQIDFVIQKRPNLTVQGLEVTQAIQYYRAAQHLTDLADRGPDNSLRLVTNKAAWVRTYLRSGQDPAFDNGQLAGVNGTLRVERRAGGVWSIIAMLPSQNGPVVAEDAFASYDAERGNISSTLNFVVPANLMTGLLRFTVTVASPFPQCPGNTASGSTQVDVNLGQTLNAAFITIAYNGPDNAGTGTLNLPAPTLAQCQAETSWAMTTYPLSGTPNVRLAGTFTTATPLNDPRSCPGCCSPNWQPLLAQVAALVALDQAANPGTWVYYGIVAAGIPVNVPGCNGWGATGGLAGQPATYAHEIGHQFGLPHARCGNAGNGNPAYPVYEPYDLPVDPPGTASWTMASIGEYGLDINNGNIANPNNAEDFMSYCGPRWISLYTHNYLVSIAGLSPQVIPTGSGAGSARVIGDDEPGFEADERTLKPLIHILGTIDLDGDAEVASVARIETRYLRGRGRQTGYVAQLLDAEGRVIAQDNVYGYPFEGGKRKDSGDCGCAESEEPQPLRFKAMLNDVAPGARLRIVKRGKVVWERPAPARLPVLTDVTAALDKENDLKVSWEFDAASKDQAEVWARWTNDNGRTWHALTVGRKGTSFTIDHEQLPSGEVRIQVLGLDGFHTVRAETETVVLPPKPPSVAIFYPGPSARVYSERQMRLVGSASSFQGGVITDDRAAWYIDDRLVANGFDVWVDNPGPGPHQLRLQVREGELMATVNAQFEVISPKTGELSASQ